MRVSSPRFAALPPTNGSFVRSMFVSSSTYFGVWCIRSSAANHAAQPPSCGKPPALAYVGSGKGVGSPSNQFPGRASDGGEKTRTRASRERTADACPQAMRLRVATFNLENLDLPRRGGVPLEERCAVLGPQLIRLNADVLCLQEVSAHGSHHGIHELRALDRLLDRTPYASFERSTTKGHAGGPSDKHNLVILSRLPIVESTQHWHDFVAPPTVRLATTPSPREEHVRWDRPVLEAQIGLPDGRALWIFDAHLRAPCAAVIEGQKTSPTVWRTTHGWSEGYFLASMKRAGQALELRQRIDGIFDDDPAARLLVAGDLNADASSTAVRILRADVEDTGNAALASRSLDALEERVEEDRRYTVIHRGHRQTLDHLLASPALARGHVATDIFNDGLEDEFFTARPVGSLHAPVVAEIEI